mgnify:CR=1 FL=1
MTKNDEKDEKRSLVKDLVVYVLLWPISFFREIYERLNEPTKNSVADFVAAALGLITGTFMPVDINLLGLLVAIYVLNFVMSTLAISVHPDLGDEAESNLYEARFAMAIFFYTLLITSIGLFLFNLL